MRVTYDDQIFAFQEAGGVSRYFTRLIGEFGHHDLDVAAQLPFRWTVNRYLLEESHRFHRPATSIGRRRPVISALNRPVRRRRPVGDLLHHTWYHPSGLEGVREPRRVSTVYDMMPELGLGTATAHGAKDAYLAASHGLACISETTKRDLARLRGLPDVPVVVTHLAADERFARAQARDVPAWAPPSYVLFVGERHTYKNFGLLLRALAALPPHEAPDLVCVGGGGFTDGEQGHLAELGLADRVHRRAVTDTELVGLYAGAVALVFPSRYEGFGLPVVEAFAAGCPVVIARTPCLEEVADGAAAVVDPDDHEELAATLERLLGEPGAADQLRASGRLRGADFSWRRTAERTAELYREVLSG